MCQVLKWGYEIVCLLAVAAVTTVASCSSAHAGTLGIHVGSQHFPAKHYNNFNPGAYYRSDEGWVAGGYRNSLRRPSVYGGYTWGSGDYSLTAGLITGYNDSVIPMIVPTVALGNHLRMAYLPKIDRKGAHVLHLMLEF